MILFSSYKKTDKVEKERNKLLSDYNSYTATENSEKLKTYLSLKEKVEATSFKKNRNEIESLRYKGSGEQRMEEEFQKLQRNSKIKTYYNVLGSENLKRYNQYEQDGSAARYEQLRNYIKSGGFKHNQKAFKSNKQAAETWETSELLKKVLKKYLLKPGIHMKSIDFPIFDEDYTEIEVHGRPIGKMEIVKRY